MTIFRSPGARQALQVWHGRFRKRLTKPVVSREIATRAGVTHVLQMGREDAPPIVVLHGALSSSAHVLSEAAGLSDRFQLIAPDIIGQSPMSADARPDVRGQAYGEWLVEVFDALRLERPAVLGVSWGGFVAIRTAAVAPARIAKLSLVVPAGLVSGSAWDGVRKVLLPMLMYRAMPSPARLERFVTPQMTTLDRDWVDYLGEAVRGFSFDMRPPRLAQNGELDALDAPVQVIAADDDVHFPGPALLARAVQVFPHLVDRELLAGCRHVPPFDDEFRRWLMKRIGGFFAGQPPRDPFVHRTVR